MRPSIVAGLCLTLSLSVGCARNPHERVAISYVNREPPPERVEVISTSPGQEYVWIKGHWAWRHDDYEWIGGHWVRGENNAREWAPGRWEHDRQGWYWVEGHWR
jgi:hypothetical protein